MLRASRVVAPAHAGSLPLESRLPPANRSLFFWSSTFPTSYELHSDEERKSLLFLSLRRPSRFAGVMPHRLASSGSQTGPAVRLFPMSLERVFRRARLAPDRTRLIQDDSSLTLSLIRQSIVSS
jgi:hypothetical protein